MKIVPHAQLESEAAKFGRTAVVNLEVPTIMGNFGVSASAYGVTMLFCPDTDDIDVLDKMDYYGMAFASWGNQRAIEAGLDLMGYFLGEVKNITSPVDLSYLTPFQKDVFNAMRSIPFGELITYGELAELAGHKGKGGAVAGVLRKNPCPIFIPCHRAVGSDGSLGVSSISREWKEWLLEHEGVDTKF
ncbi:MAG: methylated-DNA--[protein]-cysteine S-methyltransferase [Deltaproteobacteria bacterium]|nr:methylated-DNA--[protein]-cysteine S-methyltransferase [Deltaproteobacteria bacterium]